MKHLLPPLPYAYNALEPFIDAQTMEIHHTKHHQAYVDKLNLALENYPLLLKKPVEALLTDLPAFPESIRTAVRNQGGGHVNHALFWQLMTPKKDDRVCSGAIQEALLAHFDSLDAFKQQFSELALSRFGSGWAWLVLNHGKLELMSTANQDSPLIEGKTPLLGLDVWEHAYYLKWQSNRKGYIDSWWNVVNWKNVNELFTKRSLSS